VAEKLTEQDFLLKNPYTGKLVQYDAKEKAIVFEGFSKKDDGKFTHYTVPY